MPVLIVVHPHPFDNGLLKGKIPERVNSSKIPAFFVPDGDKKPYGGPNAYDGVLRPDKEKKLGRHGRAPLEDEDADRIVMENQEVFLAGGNLSECLASTYNSLLRAAERKNTRIEVCMVEDLIYLQAKKSGEVHTLQTLIERAPNYLEGYLQTFKDSELVHNELVDSSAFI